MTDPITDDPTLAYYEDQAAAFVADTIGVDLSPLHARFLAHLPPGAQLLDVGCGSGRDVRAFQQRGYRVSAIEPAPALARLAAAHCGQPIIRQRAPRVPGQAA